MALSTENFPTADGGREPTVKQLRRQVLRLGAELAAAESEEQYTALEAGLAQARRALCLTRKARKR